MYKYQKLRTKDYRNDIIMVESVERDSTNSDIGQHIKWRFNNLVAQTRYFDKLDKPSKSLTETQIIESCKRNVGSLNSKPKFKLQDYKTKEKTKINVINIDNRPWEPPRSKFLLYY